MVNFIKSNHIDKVLCWELSRIGRNTIEVLKTIKLLNDNCISLFIKNYNIETLNDKCEINLYLSL
ncbi:MAG: recombinase family protein [Bacteroidetes bacterium]|nr:recombinase family protein [Bacteroidota bacterium]